MNNSTEEQLTRIHLELPNHKGAGGESFWAKPLGDDLYELRNSPWFAYNLHCMDIVLAIADSPDKKPEIIKVVQRIGHKTLRVWFLPEFPADQRMVLLASLNQWKAYYENADAQLFAVDVEPDGDYQAVCDQLWAWEQEGKLVYETGTIGDETAFEPIPTDEQSGDGSTFNS
jgi:Domain of unknown function (DUF4265)